MGTHELHNNLYIVKTPTYRDNFLIFKFDDRLIHAYHITAFNTSLVLILVGTYANVQCAHGPDSENKGSKPIILINLEHF